MKANLNFYDDTMDENGLFVMYVTTQTKTEYKYMKKVFLSGHTGKEFSIRTRDGVIHCRYEKSIEARRRDSKKGG